LLITAYTLGAAVFDCAFAEKKTEEPTITTNARSMDFNATFFILVFFIV
jgi:hypothetical protein